MRRSTPRIRRSAGSRPIRLGLVVAFLATGPGAASSASGAAPAVPPAVPVFVPPEEARRLVEEADARVLDARGGSATAPYLPGAVVTSWREVRAGWLRDGRLGDPDEARAHYAERGVRIERPVVVYGQGPDGWGEEGRVWWDLTVLGHPRVAILDGGVGAWRAAGLPTIRQPAEPDEGRLPRPPRPDQGVLRVDHEVVRALVARGGLLLDVRSPDEYAGATPFLSARGGHVPGAVHLHWKTVFGPDGRLLPPAELRRRFEAAGLRSGRRIAAYCTGGVRSAFVVAVLTHLGHAASNYDGSWWDWAGRRALPVE